MSDYNLLFAVRLQNTAFSMKLKHDPIDLVDWECSILCESDFCQLLDTFKVPKEGTGLIEALTDHFDSNRHLQTARSECEPCFHLGTMKEIAARPSCRFCRIVSSATDIGRYGTKDDDLHVQWKYLQGKFDLVTMSQSGKPEGRALALGVRIVLCEGTDQAQTTIHWGRTKNTTGFDPEQVKQWLSLCENGHEAACQRDSAKPWRGKRTLQNHEFRLIDVRKECIVSRPWQSRYLALSYVWGGIEQLQLLEHTIDDLKAPGSLHRSRDRIPKTIRDAITFAYLMGEEYLWVDSLCLVQDDPRSMRDGIQLMNFVYENAFATIIAADGPDAKVGLRRLGSTSSKQCVQTIKPGFRLMALGALDIHLKKSKWSSRAWTFQEQLLSRRTIIFVNEQVYFRCRKRIWSEDTCADRFPDDRLISELRVNAMSCLAADSTGSGDLEDDEQPLPLLTNMLEYYSMRELTYENDAINAVSGILQIISTNLNSEFVQGLPIVALDYMILFQVYGDKRITTGRSPSMDRTARRRRSFSSWSWAGWEALFSWNSHPDVSPVDPPSFNHWLDHRTWIVWYKSIGSEVPKAILEEESRKVRVRSEEEIYCSRTSQPDLSGRFGKLDTWTTAPAALESFDSAYLRQDLLRFYTVTVTLTISLKIPLRMSWPTHEEVNGNTLYMSDVGPSAALYDSEGSFSGLLSFDIANFLGEDGEYELVLLSDSRNSLFHRMDLPNPHYSNPFISYQDNKQDYRLYWVMLLTWNQGVAERRGLGQILKSSIQKSFLPGPQWREIVLG